MTNSLEHIWANHVTKKLQERFKQEDFDTTLEYNPSQDTPEKNQRLYYPTNQ